jgi:hypothetical protein
MADRFRTYADFWAFYLREHSRPWSRGLHYVGTVSSLAALTAAVALSPWWLLAVPIVGYGPAWIGHFVIEKNRPATFGYPVWSLASDYRMFGLALAGRLDRELDLARQGSGPDACGSTDGS